MEIKKPNSVLGELLIYTGVIGTFLALIGIFFLLISLRHPTPGDFGIGFIFFPGILMHPFLYLGIWLSKGKDPKSKMRIAFLFSYLVIIILLFAIFKYVGKS